MAKNVKAVAGQRTGTGKSSSQVFNPLTGNYIKRDTSTGKFTDIKSDGTAFKGVRREVQITHVGVTISKAVAKKAEQAVIRTINRKVESNGK